MAERSNAAVLKTVDPKGPGVRIPLSPPLPTLALAQVGLFFVLYDQNDGVKKSVNPVMVSGHIIKFQIAFILTIDDHFTFQYRFLRYCLIGPL